MKSPSTIEVGMFAVPLAIRLYCHSSFPSVARTPISPLPMSCTYCFKPQAFETTIHEYPAPPLPPLPLLDVESLIADRQTSLPVSLSRATSIAPLPPGVHSTHGPSTSGDSEKP